MESIDFKEYTTSGDLHKKLEECDVTGGKTKGIINMIIRTCSSVFGRGVCVELDGKEYVLDRKKLGADFTKSKKNQEEVENFFKKCLATLITKVASAPRAQEAGLSKGETSAAAVASGDEAALREAKIDAALSSGGLSATVSGAGQRFADYKEAIKVVVGDSKSTPDQVRCACANILKIIIDKKWDEKKTLVDEERNKIWNAACDLRSELIGDDPKMLERLVNRADKDLSGFPGTGKKV